MAVTFYDADSGEQYERINHYFKANDIGKCKRNSIMGDYEQQVNQLRKRCKDDLGAIMSYNTSDNKFVVRVMTDEKAQNAFKIIQENKMQIAVTPKPEQTSFKRERKRIPYVAKNLD